MNVRRMLVAVIVVFVFWITWSVRAYGQTGAPIDVAADLQGLHPEVFAEASFKKWIDGDKLLRWWEVNEGKGTVVHALKGKGDSLFAALVNKSSDGQKRVDASKIFNLDFKSAIHLKGEALNVSGGGEIKSFNPFVQFNADSALLGYEVRIGKKGAANDRVFRKMDSTSFQEIIFEGPKSITPPPSSPPNFGDLCNEDELNHPKSFIQAAQSIVAGLTSDEDKAEAIARAMPNLIKYDSSDPRILAFTWSDVALARDSSDPGKRFVGVCDEYSVLSKSLLCSIGIPARIIVLTWDGVGQCGDKPVGRLSHAAVEFWSGNAWIPMEPTYGFIRKPMYYQEVLGKKNIHEIVLSQPNDKKSSVDVCGLVDAPDDQELSTFGDFDLSSSSSTDPQYGAPPN